MKKWKLYVSVCLVIGIIVTYFVFFSNPHLRIDATFVSKKIFFDNENNKVALGGINEKYRVCFYLDALQKESIDRLQGIKRIMDVYNGEEFEYTLIWENEIPWDIIKNMKFDEKQNFSLKGKSKLTDTKPSSFIINQNNIVEVIAEPSYLKLTRKIYELSKNKNFIDKVNKMIMDSVSSKYSSNIDKNKDMLLIFTSTSCKRCKEIDNLISENLELMKNKFNVIDIKPDFDQGKEYSNITEIDHHLTYFRTYASSYELEALPLFVIIDSDLKVKEYFSDTQQFINYIKKEH